jgi:hypothetical protein
MGVVMSKAASGTGKAFVRADDLHAVSQALLEKHGLSPADARIVAACLVELPLGFTLEV